MGEERKEWEDGQILGMYILEVVAKIRDWLTYDKQVFLFLLFMLSLTRTEMYVEIDKKSSAHVIYLPATQLETELPRQEFH